MRRPTRGSGRFLENCYCQAKTPLKSATYKRRFNPSVSTASGTKRGANIGLVHPGRLGEHARLTFLEWYFRYETGANPQLAELYARIVDKFLS